MPNSLFAPFIRRLCCWSWLIFICLAPELKAEVKSTNGTILFDANSDGQSEARLTSVGWALGPNLSPSSQLQVQGNAMISNSLSVGGSSGSSNLNVNGTIGFSAQSTNVNTTLGQHSSIFVDSSSSHIALTLPYAGNVGGRNYKIKKMSNLYRLSIEGGGNLIDNYSPIEMWSSNVGYPYISLFSDGHQWHVLSKSGVVVSPWTPSQITTQAWYDASDTSSLSSNAVSGNVSQWNDKSGNSLHLSQATASLQPVTGANINGFNAVNFTNSRMDTSTNPFGANVNNAFVICVHKTDSLGTTTLFSMTGPAANRWQAHAPYVNGLVYFDCGSIGAYRITSTLAYSSAGAVTLGSFYCSTTDNVQQVYKNGTLLIGDASGHSVNTAGNIMLGGWPAEYQDTTIGEFIIINGTVSTETRQKLEGYLAWKWGLAASLPTSHPYITAPPSR